MTDLRSTQVGLEAWIQPSPPTALWSTQIGEEPWVTYGSAMRSSQIGAEAWFPAVTSTQLRSTQIGAEVWYYPAPYFPAQYLLLVPHYLRGGPGIGAGTGPGGGGGGGDPTIHMIWDPATAINATLSGGNLVATLSGLNAAVYGLASAYKTSGKYYFEITWGPMGGFINGGSIGIANTSATNYDLYAMNAKTAMLSQGDYNYAAQIWAGGAFSGYYLGGTGPGGPFMSSGFIIGIAADIDNRKAWFRVVSPSFLGNLWNGNASADPTAGVNGVVVPSGPILPVACWGQNPDVYTVDFGATAFSGTVPTGFTAGWPTP